jgi:pimeloyl-[acyl-carrier protein] methyl ester esterase
LYPEYWYQIGSAEIMTAPGKIGTISWLTGWSMPNTVFNKLQAMLPEYHHASLDYSEAGSIEEMLALTEAAAREFRAAAADGSFSGLHSPLLIGGWSLGGLLALRLAANGFADGLVLLAATARFTRPKEQQDRGWPDIYVRQMIAALKKDPRAVENNFRQMLFTDSEWKAGLCDVLPPIGSWTTSALITGLQVLRDEDGMSYLPEIHCPALLIHGVEDKICPYGAAEELLAQLPQAKLISIEGCGHVPFLEREEVIAEEIRSWWNGYQDRRGSASI